MWCGIKWQLFTLDTSHKYQTNGRVISVASQAYERALQRIMSVPVTDSYAVCIIAKKLMHMYLAQLHVQNTKDMLYVLVEYVIEVTKLVGDNWHLSEC